MKSIEAARARFLKGDTWRIKVECTTGSNKNYQITGGPDWTTRKAWGKIGGSKQKKSEKTWSFWDAFSFIQTKLHPSKGYVDTECDQPTSVLPPEPEVIYADPEAAALMSAVGNLNQTTTTNKNASGYLSASRRAKIRALWLKKNGKSPKKGIINKVKKMLNLSPKIKGEIDDRFAMLELDDTPITEPKEDKSISDRFSMLELRLMSNRIQCPSEMWDDYTTQQEASGPNDAEILESLDGYGHMIYTFGFGEEGDKRGDWLACLDFKVFTDCDGVICVGYHAVINSESGSFIETVLESVGEDLKSAEGLPEYILGLGFSSGPWTEKEVQGALDCAERWREDLAKAYRAEEDTHG